MGCMDAEDPARLPGRISARVSPRLSSQPLYAGFGGAMGTTSWAWAVGDNKILISRRRYNFGVAQWGSHLDRAILAARDARGLV
jgi:hypothetical protein